MRRAPLIVALLVQGASVFAQRPPATAPASAAPPAPPAPLDDAESARAHFLQGNALYGEGNFAGALAEFEASYRSRPVAAVLFNMAQAHRELFQYVEAVDSMERYLREAGERASVEKRREAEALLGEWRALIGDLVVACDVRDAQVLVDGNVVSRSGGARVRVASGPHNVEVSAPGFATERRSVTVAGRTLANVEVQLRALVSTGHLHIEATPSGSILRLDGTPRGLLPFDDEVAAGAHEFAVTAEGFATHKDALALAVGERRSFQIALERQGAAVTESSWYQKWYFWSGLVAVVGGAIALSLIATQGKPDPYVGSLQPGVFPVGR